MSVFQMVVAIVFIGMAGHVIQEWIAMRRERNRKLDDETRARIEELEERIRTLEAIVTSRDYDLKKAFEELERE
ncbi:MAG TPA: hypothetical protein ENK54_04985 [Thiotrichales bacterium]|nr:hypothetical protein [Thiotrichales bacterium]